jgi:hypothetical protein
MTASHTLDIGEQTHSTRAAVPANCGASTGPTGNS